MGRSLLLLVTGLTIITGLIQVQNSERTAEIPKVSEEYYKSQQARNLSKSLIDNAVEQLKNNNSWEGSISLDEVASPIQLLVKSIPARKSLALGNMNIDEVLQIEEQLQNEAEDALNNRNEDYEHLIGNLENISASLKSYTQHSTNIPEGNSVGTWDEYKLLLISTSRYEDIEVTTEVLMQRDSFSKYSYMTQSELSSSGTRIWFTNSDKIYGPIHTNGEFAMSGSPSFYGLVTSPNMWVANEDYPTSPNFYGGENFNAPEKAPPSSYEISRLAQAANNGGKRYDTDIDVNFWADENGGYAEVSYNGSPVTECRKKCTTVYETITETINLEDINGVISTSGKITVDGEVKGSVTLHSESEIEIMGDITYKTNPMEDSSSTDLLGLVSEGDVILDKNAHKASGTQDVTIHASILALKNSFRVENYNSGGPRGAINLLGGITQEKRGAVGTFSGSSMLTGYYKNYMYDNRLKASIPPFFPRESIFSIVYWKETTRKIEI